jgi:Zn-finger protein
MEHYKFFQNRECEFFPCHSGADPETFSCLFCYCPLYALSDKCGGNCTFLGNGIKDCSNCLFPHKTENYDAMMVRMADVLKLASKDQEKP